MFGRRHAKTRRELVRAEFGESADLLRQAALHAAGGVGATMGPGLTTTAGRLGAMRGQMVPSTTRLSNAATYGWHSTVAAIAPLAAAARQGSAQASKLPSGRGRPGRGNRRIEIRAASSTRNARLLPLLTAGAVVGAAAATLAARRRNRAHWAGYEPSAVRADGDRLIDTTRAGLATDALDERRGVARVTGWAKDAWRQQIRRATGAGEPATDGAAPDRPGIDDRASGDKVTDMDELLRTARNARI